MDAAIGLAQWAPGQSMHEIIGLADAAMYAQERESR